jgi:hypothetical protein
MAALKMVSVPLEKKLNKIGMLFQIHFIYLKNNKNSQKSAFIL